MLARGGVALTDSADASRCYPDLWRTPAAARQAFHRARRVTGPCGGAPPDGQRHAPLRRAAYQRAGAGKRPASLVFDPGTVPVAELRGWLEERIGPLVRLEVDPPHDPPPGPPGRPLEPAEGPPAPMPVADGPAAIQEAAGGAPGPLSGPDHPAGVPAAPAVSAASCATMARRPAALPDRMRLSDLAQRLSDARPKQQHGVRRLDFEAWEAAARAAAGLPSAEWAAWRATGAGAHRGTA